MVALVLLSGCASKLGAPEPISPKAGANFHHFPRTTELRWTPVGGAASYSVEVDCFHCCEVGKWCTEVGQPRMAASRIRGTSYQFSWVGANLGRWRVWAVDKDGHQGAKTEWQDFLYSQ